MARAVNVAIACTNRKTQQPGAELHLRNVSAPSLEERAKRWVRRLRESNAPVSKVENLYSGDHWVVGRSLAEDALGAGLKVRLHVCSAGYGLLPMHAEVRPYAATFTPGHPDAVQSGADSFEAPQIWWHLLGRWPGPSPRSPRSLAALASTSPRTPLLVAVSPHYLEAVLGDLEAAQAELASPELLSVFSAGSDGLESIEGSLIPCDARLQHAVGGTRFSLNVRAARLALRNADSWTLRAPELREQFLLVLRRQPCLPRWNRHSMSDAEVAHFIRQGLRRQPQAARTRLLRELRDSGRACEQSRFARLYAQVRDEGILGG